MELLKERVRQQLFALLTLPPDPRSKLKCPSQGILIVDSVTRQLLDSMCNIRDLYKRGITTIQEITSYRKKRPKVQAFYLLSPSRQSVKVLLGDFEDDEKPQHNEVHLIFDDAVPRRSLFDLLALPPLYNRIKSLHQASFGFNLFQEAAFHINQTDVFRKYHEPDEEAYSVVRALTDVCDLLEVNPTIRYAKTDICPDVAREMQKTIVERRQQAAETGVVVERKATLLIVGRSIDLQVALMHATSYEAAVFDVVEEFDIETGRVDVDGKKVKLHGALFEKLRYSPLECATDTLEAFVREQYSKVRRYSKKKSREAMLDVMLDYNHFPYKDLKDMSQFHLTLLGKVRSRLASILDVTQEEARGGGREEYKNSRRTLEMELVTGVDERSYMAKQKELATVLYGILIPDLSSDHDNLRLLLLYFTLFTREQLTDVEKGLLDVVPIEFRGMVNKFREIVLLETGVQIEKRLHRRSSWSDTKAKLSTKKDLKISKLSTSTSTSLLPSDRYTPRLYTLVEDLVMSNLDKIEFPEAIIFEKSLMVEDIPLKKAAGSEEVPLDKAAGSEGYEEGSTPSAIMPLRLGFRLSSLWTIFKKKGKDSMEKKEDSKDQDIIIVFVIGGITLAEIRAAYELKHCGLLGRCELLVGGSCILTPARFLHSLKDLATNHRNRTLTTRPSPDPILSEKVAIRRRRKNHNHAQQQHGSIPRKFINFQRNKQIGARIGILPGTTTTGTSCS